MVTGRARGGEITMAGAALFIGWGPVVHTRERKSLQVFNEAIQYYTKLQEQGEVEGFGAYFLEPHGGDLAGFLLLRGERDKLNRLRHSPEFLRLNNRAQAAVENVGVVSAYMGEELNRLLGTYEQEIGDLL